MAETAEHHTATPQWFLNWAEYHCKAFGFQDAQAETVWTWWPVFCRLFTVDELGEATDHLLSLESTPKWASDHRALLMARVRQQRARAAAPPPSDSLHRPPAIHCIECAPRDGSPSLPGMIRVPHPGHDPNTGRWRDKLEMPERDPDGDKSLGRWTWVACVLCGNGHKAREASEQPGRQRLATISEYEARYPRWRDVAHERRRVLAMMAQAGRPLTAAEQARKAAELKQIGADAAAAEAARKPQGFK